MNTSKQQVKIKPEDLLGNFELKIDIENSEPACIHCLPSKPLKDHKSINGVFIHERIDVEPGKIYMVNEDKESNI